MKAADGDGDSGLAERARDIQRARILVRLHADERDEAEIVVATKARESAGTSTRVLVSSIASMSIATSGPSTCRSALSAAMP